MVNLTREQMRELMSLTHNIRNVSMITRDDATKRMITYQLWANRFRSANHAPFFVEPREMAHIDKFAIEWAGSSLLFEYDVEAATAIIRDPWSEAVITQHSHLINLIDWYGCVDFNPEVTAMLRVTDGAIVVVDCIDGVCVQTATLLRRAISERVKPVLMLNNIERVFLELQLEPEECYQSFVRAIQSVNMIVASYSDAGLGDCKLHPQNGTVAFGSGVQEWSFTLKKFAQLYSAKFGIDETKMMEKLWGNWYFDADNKKWVTKQNAAGTLKRAFSQFVMDPIAKIFDAVMNNKKDTLEKMLNTIRVELTTEEKNLTGEPLLQRVMQRWLPVAGTILEMVVTQLPSPVTAQKYRVETLYEGPMDDECAHAIRNCDADGPLVMYVSKLIPASYGSPRFYAFGRVFAGKVSSGQAVRILGSNYTPDKKTDLWVKNIKSTWTIMGHYVEQAVDIPAGNTCALLGVDQYLLKSGTLTTSETGHAIRTMKFSVSPVVRVAVEPLLPTDLPKLVEGIKRLSKSGLMAHCYTEYTGEHIIAGANELHLEMSLKSLQEDFMGTSLKISEPFVAYRETITEKSDRTCLSKSPNRHNRLFCVGLPLGDQLTKEIEDGKEKAGASYDVKLRARYLANNHGWDGTEARKIWCYGPDGTGPNMLVDATKGGCCVHEIKESVIGGFQWATMDGVLCNENVRGMRINLLDVVLLADAIHRGMGQIMPTARRVIYACQLTAKPALMEPVLLTEIMCPQDAVGGCYGVLTRRRGHVFAEEQRPGAPMVTLKAYLPVNESFSFTADLCAATGGKALTQCVFDHYQVVAGDPVDVSSMAGKLVNGTRVRKGLAPEVPPLDRFYDKL